MSTRRWSPPRLRPPVANYRCRCRLALITLFPLPASAYSSRKQSCAVRDTATTASVRPLHLSAHHGGCFTHRHCAGRDCPAPDPPRSEKLQHHISAPSSTAATTPAGSSPHSGKAAAATGVVECRRRSPSQAKLVNGDGSHARDPYGSRCACAHSCYGSFPLP